MEPQKKPRLAKTILNRKKKLLEVLFYILDDTLYYRARVIKTAWYWSQNKHIVQWIKCETEGIKNNQYQEPAGKGGTCLSS